MILTRAPSQFKTIASSPSLRMVSEGGGPGVLVNRCALSVFAAVTLLGLALPATSRADTLLAGTISFDTGVSPSSNTFDLDNLTGVNNAGAPDAIVDDESISGSLTLYTSAGNFHQFFSGVDDSGANATLYSLASSVQVYSAYVTFALSKSTGVNIYNDSDPNIVVANLGTVPSVTFSPLGGGTALTPCDGSGSPCATSLITVDTLPPSTGVTPEPETVWLVLTGIGGAAAFVRKRRGR